MTTYLLKNPIEVEGLFQSAIYFDQLFMLWHLDANINDGGSYRSFLIKNSKLLLQTARTVLSSPTCRLTTYYIDQKMIFGPDEGSFEDRVYFLLTLIAQIDPHDGNRLIRDALVMVHQRIRNGEAHRKELVELLIALNRQSIYADRKHYDDEIADILPEAKSIFINRPG